MILETQENCHDDAYWHQKKVSSSLIVTIMCFDVKGSKQKETEVNFTLLEPLFFQNPQIFLNCCQQRKMMFAAKWRSYDMNQQGIPCFILFFLSPAFLSNSYSSIRKKRFLICVSLLYTTPLAFFFVCLQFAAPVELKHLFDFIRCRFHSYLREINASM